MIDPEILSNYQAQMTNLRTVVVESEARVLSEEPDLLFLDNQNVFIKSYVVSACSILEAFVQDLLFSCNTILQTKINQMNLPINFVNWLAENDKPKKKFAQFSGNKTRKDISDLVSPNFFKTQLAFEVIGIDIMYEPILSFKDYICAMVDKRNRIVHHNDAASDISFNDVKDMIDEFGRYALAVFNAVVQNSHLKS